MNCIFLPQFSLQAGFAAEGAETGTRFPEVNLLEKVCFLRCLHFRFKIELFVELPGLIQHGISVCLQTSCPLVCTLILFLVFTSVYITFIELCYLVTSGFHEFQDWTDYDENASESVGIYEVTHQFKKC